ncbi:SusC/RagA family TonB-linked outer membrane protein [Pedobacter miscanthi]|uniref:SusC/RagA family TonB-linked outer membrane protein n=1 Tax=Pedobacter miscanthi TaxID=2259170 RepID=A0A366L1U1_9SPHI|nr:SusC/RagA family TonB-linked outer membrane protein [Pedobacter miscanthi]RBQ07871.1 hypothetical protein DRW42_09725 [Pedobacter miscanthi]
MLKYLYILISLVFVCGSSSAQSRQKIEGLVIDYLSSKPLKDANVSIKGSVLKNVNTKADGTFSIEVPSAYGTLIISYPGYQLKEFPLGGQQKVAITIVPENVYIGESTVNLPYGNVNEKDLHGAYGVVFNTNDRARDLGELLQGKVAGLESNAYSGTPGEGVKYNLRGIRSLYTTNEPLIILDGVPVYNPIFKASVSSGNIYNSLSDVNVKDVESVTILKDVSAAGIYGSRAANGAIVITTKGGTNGKTFLDVSVQAGITTRFNELPMMSSSEYLPFLSGRLYAQGLTAQDIQARFPFFNLNPTSSEYLKYGNNTNWQREITQNALTNDFYINLRGGDATSKYSFQVGYNDAQGNIREVSANRFTSRFNLDFKILKNFKAGTHISFSRTEKNLMDQGFDEGVNPLYLSLVKPPITSPYIQKSTGVNSEFFTEPTFDNLSNPMAVVKGVKNNQKNFWIMGSVYGDYSFNNSLSTKAVISLDHRSLEEDRFTPAIGLVPLNSDPRFDRTSVQQIIGYQVLRFEHTLSYNKQLSAEHRVTALAGYNAELASASSIYGYSRHSTDDAFQSLGDGTRVLANGSDDKYHNMAVFANAEYGFREKLFLKAGIRFDASSKFGENAGGLTIGSTPFAVLPYVNISWKLKSEPWMNAYTFIDELTLRSSAGKTANQDIPVNARYSLYNKAFYGAFPGLAPTSMGNSQVRWETTNSYNGGLDISLFKKALTVNFDYFNTTTDNVLVRKLVDGAYGQGFYWGNEGSINNRGFELGLGTIGYFRKVRWTLGVNLAKYNNKVLSLPNGAVIDGVNGYQSIAKTGSAVGLFYGYKYLGVFSTSQQAAASGLVSDMGTVAKAGDVEYEDINHDGKISNADRQVIGNPNPKLFGGFNGSVSYKNFDLSTIFSFSYGNDVFNVLRSKLENGAAYENQSVTALSRWSAEGDIAGIPATAYGDPLNNRRASSYFVEDGSYLKMRALTLAYNIRQPYHFIRSAQLYLTGYNLLRWTNYSGWDPEVTVGQDVFSRGYDFGNVPQSKTFMLGIKLGL